MSRTTELKIRVPPEMAAAVRTVTQAREQTINDYVKRAIRNQLIADATGMEADTLRNVVAEATTPIMRAANFGAVHAAATVGLLREVLRDRYTTQGLPDDLARDKVEALVESMLGEALATFENPKILHQFGWIERPADGDELPDWFADADD